MDQTIICSIIATFIICIVLGKILKNRTIQVEKFTNSSVVYTANGKKLE